MMIMFFAVIALVSYSFKEYSLYSIENKARVLAKTIEHSLTSHMINKVIDKRAFFLKQNRRT